MNVLILHGILGSAGENWGQWLCDELITRSYNVTMPSLPNSDHPDRQEWYTVIANLMAELGSDTIIVAHSLGVTSSLDFLETAAQPIKGLVSVSGFSDDYGYKLNSYFLKEKNVDFEKVNKNLGKAFAFFGDNDPYVTQEALHNLADALKVKPVIIPNGGHLNAAAGFNQFPQLLDAVLSV